VAAAKTHSIKSKKVYTINQYANDVHDTIDFVLYEGGFPGRSAQPNVYLLRYLMEKT